MKAAVCVQATESLASAARELKHEDIGCMIVCQGRRVVGMITDRDIAMRGVAEGRNASQMTVGEAMSTEVLYCFGDDSVEQAATLMNEGHVHRLAVLDRNTRDLIGLVSLSDLSGGEREGCRYEVTFYKKMNDHYGHSHHTELMRVAVAHGTKEEAIVGAIRQFEQAKHLTAWNQLADGYDVTTIHRDEQGAMIEDLELTSEREAQIRSRARELWKRAGSPMGQDERFWHMAATEIDGKTQ
ncbi:CBS domain-containing protein [Cupriavidus necator]